MQEVNFDTKNIVESEINSEKNKRKRFKRFRNWYSSLSHNQRYVFWISSIVGIVLILGVLSLLIILFRPSSSDIKASNVKFKPLYSKPKYTPAKKYVDPLDGVYVNSKSVLDRPALSVMIENSLPARPQSGLSSADLVYEAQVEGDITRFMAVYLAHSPTMIGPIRSARLYYIAWAQGLGSIYTHWGGNIYALEKLQKDNIPNINALTMASSGVSCSTPNFIFCRLDTRYAPHNGYGNTQEIWALAKQQGLYSSLTLGKNIVPYTFENTPKQSQLGPNGSNITIFFDQNVQPYSVNWVYNQSTNSYTRYNGGTEQIDANTQQPLTTKNVVVLYINGYTTSYPGEGTTEAAAPIWILQTTGSGNAYIFNNGKETKATWTKTSSTSRMTFTQSNGNPVQFQRGQIWFEVLEPQTGSFTYTQGS